MSTVNDMPLTEFLLARISDKEREARYTLREGMPQLTEDRSTLLAWAHGSLAECAAKRSIVESYIAAVLTPVESGTQAELRRAEIEGRWKALGDVLAILALPYADHPDYPLPANAAQERPGPYAKYAIRATDSGAWKALGRIRDALTGPANPIDPMDADTNGLGEE